MLFQSPLTQCQKYSPPQLSSVYLIYFALLSQKKGRGEHCGSGAIFSVWILNTFFVFGGTWNNNEMWNSPLLNFKYTSNSREGTFSRKFYLEKCKYKVINNIGGLVPNQFLPMGMLFLRVIQEKFSLAEKQNKTQVFL